MVQLYALERSSRLTYPRLKACISDLQEAGMVSASLEVTDLGYSFLEEVSRKVVPVLVKYGLWQERR